MNKKCTHAYCSITSLLTEHPELYRFMKFGVVGTTAMLIHYGIYYLLMNVMDLNVAFSIGYFVSFLCNYLLTSYFTFGVSPSLTRFLRFGTSHLTNYLLQICLLNVVLYVGVPSVWAPVPVYAVSIPVSFALVRMALLWKATEKND